MFTKDSKTIAVDFDGTIVEDAFPKIGKPQMFAFETLKQLQIEGYCLVLWTYREGELLDEAVEFCKKNGLIFYAINKNFPEEIFSEKTHRKLKADLFIDDRNLGGLPPWGEIYNMLTKNKIKELKVKKKSFFTFGK